MCVSMVEAKVAPLFCLTACTHCLAGHAHHYFDCLDCVTMFTIQKKKGS